MKRIIFRNMANGAERIAQAPDDQRLLEVAQLADQPLEGTCEGQMACSTCHVILEPAQFALLPPASEEEEDMLDLASGAVRTSRLSCQILIADCPDGLIVKIPGESRDMQRL